VLVSADLGDIFQSLKLEVVKRLKGHYGDLYSEKNVMLTATHTHVGTGGLSHYALYQIASADAATFGYSSQNFEAVVSGIVQSIIRAHNNLAPGSIEFVEGTLNGATKNRSLIAYEANADDQNFSSNVNKTMSMLKFKKADGTEVGMLNWFAIHNTSLSIEYDQISGDNKGYAQHLFERRKGTDFGVNSFVAAFANSDEGDVVPSDGNANSAAGFGGSSNEILNAERAGERQFDKAWSLYNQEGTILSGGLHYQHRWANFEDYWVSSQFTGNQWKKLCSAARGFSFAAGGENGPSNIPGIYEGMTRDSFSIGDAVNQVDQSALGGLVRLAFGAISLGAIDDCQEQKPNLLATGALNLVPEVVPVQLFVIGDFAILAMPGEVTTMAGRRLRQTVINELGAMGVQRAVIAGLANTYTGYVTTNEEFQEQHYEGASTAFGPHTLSAYQQEFYNMADAIKSGTTVSDDKQPRDRSNDIRFDRPGVFTDSKYFWEKFGQVLTDAQSNYNKGQVAKVSFRGGHPKNNLKSQGSFLTIQRWQGGGWVDYLKDSDWNTEYRWKRDGLDRSIVDISWRIPSNQQQGYYRIKHDGHWKHGFTRRISSYSGTSKFFYVD
jgi:neutral ceramidase